MPALGGTRTSIASRAGAASTPVHGRPLARAREALRPKPSARFVIAHAEQGFTANVPLAASTTKGAPRVPRPTASRSTPEHGWPLRLVSPASTSGRARNGSAASSSRLRTSPASGSATGTTTTRSPLARRALRLLEGSPSPLSGYLEGLEATGGGKGGDTHPCGRGGGRRRDVRCPCGSRHQDHRPYVRPPRRRYGRHDRVVQQRRARRHRAAGERQQNEPTAAVDPLNVNTDDRRVERLLHRADDHRRIGRPLLELRDGGDELDQQLAARIPDRHIRRGTQLRRHPLLGFT